MKTFVLSLLAVFACQHISAQVNDQRKSVQLQAIVSEDPTSIELSWDQEIVANSNISVFRRPIGSTS